MRPLLGTFVEIGIASVSNAPQSITSNKSQANDIITAAFKVVDNVHKLLSFQSPDSELSQLNRSGKNGIELDPVSIEVLTLALDMTKRSQGAFNCTIGGSLVKTEVLPDHGGITPLEVGNENDVVLNGCHVRLMRPVRITLDGIAKGFAVDAAIDLLKSRGVTSGWVNAGGDMRMFGEIDMPVYRRELDGSSTFLGEFSNTAIATSTTTADYDSRFPGVILDATSQKPVQGIWTVTAEFAWLADALTKVASASNGKQVSSKISALGGKLLAGPEL